jgi:hypothetical protein
LHSAAGARRRVKPLMGPGRAHRGTAGGAATSDAIYTATGTNRVVHGHRPRGRAAADGGREEEEMVMWRKRRQWGRQETS